MILIPEAKDIKEMTNKELAEWYVLRRRTVSDEGESFRGGLYRHRPSFLRI